MVMLSFQGFVCLFVTPLRDTSSPVALCGLAIRDGVAVWPLQLLDWCKFKFALASHPKLNGCLCCRIGMFSTACFMISASDSLSLLILIL